MYSFFLYFFSLPPNIERTQFVSKHWITFIKFILDFEGQTFGCESAVTIINSHYGMACVSHMGDVAMCFVYARFSNTTHISSISLLY